MRTNLLAFIDWNRSMWVVQYRDGSGNVVTEVTAFTANTPSIVVCDKLLHDQPMARVFAKITS